jgi:hypothetical protein
MNGAVSDPLCGGTSSGDLMQTRRLRLGDVVDDYCPRERRLSNHVVVAMVEDAIKQTRCSTCDFEHPYKDAKLPARRKKKDSTAALYQQVLDGMTERPPAIGVGAKPANASEPEPPSRVLRTNGVAREIPAERPAHEPPSPAAVAAADSASAPPPAPTPVAAPAPTTLITKKKTRSAAAAAAAPAAVSAAPVTPPAPVIPAIPVVPAPSAPAPSAPTLLSAKEGPNAKAGMSAPRGILSAKPRSPQAAAFAPPASAPVSPSQAAPDANASDADTDPDAPVQENEPAHRRTLIRATLPRPAGEVPTRVAPTFTIREAARAPKFRRPFARNGRPQTGPGGGNQMGRPGASRGPQARGKKNASPHAPHRSGQGSGQGSGNPQSARGPKGRPGNKRFK